MSFIAFILVIIFYVILQKHINTLEVRLRDLEKTQRVSVSVESKPTIDSVVVAQHGSDITKPTQSVQSVQSARPKVETQSHSIETFANRIAKVGIAILAIGILYFLSYINSQGFFGPTAKFSIGLVVGAVCVLVAEFVKRKSSQYAQIVRGGGFLIWYIALYVGTFSYNIISLPMLLVLIAGILCISAIVSIRERKETSFFLGVLGSYLMPMIAGAFLTVREERLQILMYIVIINLGIVGVSIFKNWRKSVIVGFFATWIIFAGIMTSSLSMQYSSFADMYPSWQTLWLFATVFGLQFLITFVLADIRRSRAVTTTTVESTPKTRESDVLLTATNTFAYVWFAYTLVSGHLDRYMGYFTLLLGLFHFGVYLFIRKLQGSSSNSVSALTHFVIFVVLLTAAIPMQFDGPLVTMVWFIEGVVLSYLATTTEFKNKGIMYVLGLAGIVLGIIHMILYGSYTSVMNTGTIVFNQQYLVWFFVAALVHFIAFLWKNIEKARGAAVFLFVLGQVFFVTLSSVEVWDFYEYKVSAIYTSKHNTSANFEDYYGYSVYDEQATPEQRTEFDRLQNEISEQTKKLYNMAAFVNAIFFVFMTTIYLLIGLLQQNKIFRRLGVVMLVVTLIQIISLVWQFGPVYRFITFSVFGIILLILSYLYIHHNRKTITTNQVK